LLGPSKLASEPSLNANIPSFSSPTPAGFRRPDGRYDLIAGNLRLRAAKQAGLTTIPAVELDPGMPETRTLEVSLAENIHRQALNPYDEAEAYRILREKGVKQKDLAAVVGKSQPYVAKRLRLLKLHPKVREHIRQRMLSPEHGQDLLKLKNPEQLKLAQETIEKHLTRKQLRERIREITGRKLKWQLIPIRLTLEEYEALKRLAPKGDIKQLIQEAVKKLIK
jgi:ParB family chromosome partitioning protein